MRCAFIVRRAAAAAAAAATIFCQCIRIRRLWQRFSFDRPSQVNLKTNRTAWRIYRKLNLHLIANNILFYKYLSMYYSHRPLSTRPLHAARYLFSMKPLVVDLCLMCRLAKEAASAADSDPKEREEEIKKKSYFESDAT